MNYRAQNMAQVCPRQQGEKACCGGRSREDRNIRAVCPSLPPPSTASTPNTTFNVTPAATTATTIPHRDHRTQRQLTSLTTACPSQPPLPTPAWTPTPTSSRACRNRTMPCSTTRPSASLCTTVCMPPASRRACTTPSRT